VDRAARSVPFADPSGGVVLDGRPPDTVVLGDAGTSVVRPATSAAGAVAGGTVAAVVVGTGAEGADGAAGTAGPGAVVAAGAWADGATVADGAAGGDAVEHVTTGGATRGRGLSDAATPPVVVQRQPSTAQREVTGVKNPTLE
jgi:hypothetical protein